MKLTREERSAIFRGDHRALKRQRRPSIKAGGKVVLSWTRGGRQVVDRETGATVDIPRKPTVWIEFREPELKKGMWVIQFIAHDEREPLRLLGATPGPKREAGLKTRWRDPSQVPGKGEEKEHWTPEAERGYGSSGRVAIDSGEGVDDQTLKGYGAQARQREAEFKKEMAEADEEMALKLTRGREIAIRDRLRGVLRALPCDSQVDLLAAIEREIHRVA